MKNIYGLSCKACFILIIPFTYGQPSSLVLGQKNEFYITSNYGVVYGTTKFFFLNGSKNRENILIKFHSYTVAQATV